MKYARQTITLPRSALHPTVAEQVVFRVPEVMPDREEPTIVANPFAAMVVSQLTAAGRAIPGKAIMLTDGDRQVHVASHSDRYQPISNTDVLEIATATLHQAGVDANPALGFWDGKRFSLLYTIADHSVEIRENDRACIGLLVQNSYDGRLTFGVRFMAVRFICVNGMFFGDAFGGFAFRHLESTGDQTVKDAAARLPEHINAFRPILAKLPRLASFAPKREQVLGIACALSDGSPSWPDATIAQGLMEYHKTGDASAWGLLNALTRIATHDVPPFTGMELSRVACTAIMGLA